MRCCHASCSSVFVAKATWWTVPPPGRPFSAGGSFVCVEPAARLAAHLPGAAFGLEAERPFEEGAALLGVARVRANRVESLQCVLAGNFGILGDERLVARVDDLELEDEALGVGEAQRALRAFDLDALRAEPLGPEVERLLGRDAEDDGTAPSRRPHGRAARPGYSKNVMSEPALPRSSA